MKRVCSFMLVFVCLLAGCEGDGGGPGTGPGDGSGNGIHSSSDAKFVMQMIEKALENDVYSQVPMRNEEGVYGFIKTVLQTPDNWAYATGQNGWEGCGLYEDDWGGHGDFDIHFQNFTASANGNTTVLFKSGWVRMVVEESNSCSWASSYKVTTENLRYGIPNGETVQVVVTVDGSTRFDGTITFDYYNAIAGEEYGWVEVAGGEKYPF